MASSPINQSGAASIITGVLALITPYLDSIKVTASTLEINPLYVFGAVAIVVGGIAIYQRVKQRKGGWA